MLTVHLLGQFSLKLDDESVELPSRPAQSLLAWLVLHPGIAHRREQIAGLLWPDASEENARNNLRHALWRLRRAIPDGYVQSDRIAIGWLAEAEWWLDVDSFSQSATQASRADDLFLPLRAYRGELLPGFYDEWIFRERERLSAIYSERMARLLELLVAEQRWRETIDDAEKWIAIDHAPEPAYRALMLAHAGLGNSAAALAAYQRCVDALHREVGVHPSPETEALAEQIRGELFRPAPARGQEKRMTLSAAISSNLPAATTPLIGREAEVAQLSVLLTSPDHRLVTIVGPGGMGKSRLAIAAGQALLNSFPDGIFMVELVALTSAEELPRAIGTALHYPFQENHRPLRQQIVDFLRKRTLLLLLDNFEHLLEGAAFLVELLEAAPGLHLLVTSRERLRLHAETTFRLDGLVYPTSRQAEARGERYGAVELFVRTVQRVRQDFALGDGEWAAIARICRMVGGLPLGIVLAAGWSGSLSVAEIAVEMAADTAFLVQEMGDLDPRHRAITRVFEQSWQRLSPTQQQALAGMSLFAGGFDREAARAVTGATLPTLSLLVDKSLLWRVGEARYDLHELIRQFARQKLIESGENARRRGLHCSWFLARVAAQTAQLKGIAQDEAIAQMEAERENIRAAWLWGVEMGETRLLQQAIEALGIFYNRPGYSDEGKALLAQAISGLEEASTPETLLLYGWLLAWHAYFLHQTGEPSAAQERMAGALAVVEGETLAERDSLLLRAFIYLYRGGDLMTDRQRGAKIQDLRLALSLFRRLGNDWWTVHTMIILGHTEVFNGSIRHAMEGLQEALLLARRAGIRSGEVQILHQMSFAAEQMGQVAEGERLVREALAMTSDEARRQSMLGRLAFVLLAAGKFEESIAISQTSIEWSRKYGSDTRHNAFTYNNLARGFLDLGRFSEAKGVAEQAVQRWMDTYGWPQPFLLRSVAMATLALGDVAEARRLIHQTLESQQRMGNDNLFALSGAYIDCVYPALVLEREIEARQLLLNGLKMAQRADAFNYEGLGFPAAALLLAREGRLPEAALVNGAIRNIPRLVLSRWYTKMALDELNQRLTALPANLRTPAEARGATLALPELTAELLALL